MTSGTDRASKVRALILGDTAVEFETALQDTREKAEVETVIISLTHFIKQSM
jgi:hypothetical protein